MKSVIALVLVALLAPQAFAQKAQKKASLRDQLIGGWHLVAITNDPSAKKLDAYGRRQDGYLSFERNGKFSMQVYPMRTAIDRGATPVGRAQTMVGTYKVNEKQGVLELHLEQNTFPNIDSADQRRIIKLSGDDLRLTNPKPAKGWSAHMIWKRAKKK